LLELHKCKPICCRCVSFVFLRSQNENTQSTIPLTSLYSIAELAMESDTWAKDNRREDHFGDTFDCGWHLQFPLRASKRLSAIILPSRGADSQSVGLVHELNCESTERGAICSNVNRDSQISQNRSKVIRNRTENGCDLMLAWFLPVFSTHNCLVPIMHLEY
jgi:hypothetical protein